MTNRRTAPRSLDARTDRRDPQRGFRIRLAMVTCLFGLLGSAVIARAVWLQIIQHTDLSQRAVSQYQKSVYLYPSRGVIFDRRGRELAANVQAWSVYAEPAEVDDKRGTALRLARELDVPADRLEKALSKGRGFAWLKRQVTPREARGVKDLKIDGIGLFAESKRFYPHRDLASQLIGFAGVDSQGLAGVEYSHDKWLRGNAGWLVVQRDALDRAVFVEGYQDDPDNRGQDLRLTLDQNIQHFAQEEIRRAVDESQAKEGIVIVMDPNNGDVLALAMGSYFNPNSRESIEEGRWKNVCLSHAYEPGSTMKPFVVAGALEEGTVTPSQVFYCGDGAMTLYNKTIRDVHPYGDLTVREIVSLSSNIGAIKIGQTLSRERFHRWLGEFGFGEPTGIDLPGESRGLLRPPSTWSGLSQASMSIGQEIGVTPLQMAAAYASIAADGLLRRPRVVAAVSREGRDVKVFPPETVRRVISPRTARTLKDILRQTVTEGTGKAAAIPGYTVAGKTGTAQKFDAAAGSYTTGKYLSSFIGFAPAHEPAVVILVMLDEPIGSYYGGSVAAPVFSRVGERVLNYLAVPSDDPEGLARVIQARREKEREREREKASAG